MKPLSIRIPSQPTPGPGAALRDLKALDTRLENDYPDAAASLRKGIGETLTVQKMGISGLFQKRLSTTNPIESAINVVQDWTNNVKCCQNGKMVQRGVASGLFDTEIRFRRIKGYRVMMLLKNEIRRLILK